MSGTFAVTTNDNYTTIPFHKAKKFRLNNFTGKLVGARRRHNKINLDDFEDLNNPEWVGDLSVGFDDPAIEGSYGATIKSQSYRPLTSEVMLDGSEVEVKFRVPDISGTTVTIEILDNISRLGIGFAAEMESTFNKAGEYKVTFELIPSTSKFNTYLEDASTLERTQLSTNEGGSFGSNDMKDSIICVKANREFTIDSIVYNQKVNYSHEILLNSSSVTYPCDDNISEYEIINLGSDVLNYSDNSDNISLSGFYES